MQLFYSKRISIENNPYIYFFEDYLNFVIQNELENLFLNDKIKPKCYFFEGNRHITLLEWLKEEQENWNDVLKCLKTFFKSFSEREEILGYTLVWASSRNEINFVIKYLDSYEEVYENQAFIYRFDKIDNYYLGSPLKKATIRKDFFSLI